MNVSKLKTIHVVIIGSLACVLLMVGVYFFVLKKCYERIDGLEIQLSQLTQEYAKKASVESQLEAAKEQNRIVSIKYENYLRSKMPPISFENPTQGMIALWKEQSEVLGPLLASYPSKTGVVMRTGVTIPAAPTDPGEINSSLIEIPVGNFQVQGDFRTLLSHIRSWNNFNRLVKIETGRMGGESPQMTVDYEVTVYIFPRGESAPPPAPATDYGTVDYGGSMPPDSGGGMDDGGV